MLETCPFCLSPPASHGWKCLQQTAVPNSFFAESLFPDTQTLFHHRSENFCRFLARTACACSAHPSLSSTSSLFRFDHWPCFYIHSSHGSLFPLVPWAIYSFDVGKHHTVLHKCIPWNQVSPAAFWSYWFPLNFGQAIPAAFVFLWLLATGLQSAHMPSVISWNQNCMKCWAKKHFHTSLEIC